jgi:hypothetical protein
MVRRMIVLSSGRVQLYCFNVAKHMCGRMRFSHRTDLYRSDARQHRIRDTFITGNANDWETQTLRPVVRVGMPTVV